MYIRLTAIELDNIFDAPFIGTLLSGSECNMDCKDCHNKDLKKAEVHLYEIVYLMKMIKENEIVEGLIFGGLEWTNQMLEMKCLIKSANQIGLKNIMIYTGYTEPQFKPYLDSLKLISFTGNLYIKYGKHESNNLSNNNIHYGVRLSSKNQYIKHYKL